ncbi:MAG: hypothetical protein HKN73_06850 [Gemmatimonadetes bacterium]|nr:hypothetical protein [Gemmatimonadota bacterium]
MSDAPTSTNGTFWRVVLVLAIVAEGYTLYAIPSASARLSLGILLLTPIVWAAGRIELVDYIETHVAVERPIRRFKRLRTQVVQFLGEVKRLNWLAVDLQRGSTDRARLLDEMDAIEERLNGLVSRIREEAGRA